MAEIADLPKSISLGYPTRFYEPLSNPQDTSKADLVVMCSWMGASLRHVAKYIAGYRLRYPSAGILLIESSLMDVAWRSNDVQQRRLGPAVAMIRSIPEQAAKAGVRVVCHVFSNGGAQSFCQLATAYRTETGGPLPLRSMVCDSCPGRATWNRSATAMIMSLPKNPILRFVGTAVVHLLIAFVFSCDMLFGTENVIEKARRLLLDAMYVTKEVPRSYLFSKSDALVMWQDVAVHAESARRQGIQVHEVMFEKSAHVNHIREDEEKYWKGVTSSLE